MADISAKVLEKARDPKWVRQAVAKARKATGGPNACAATLSVLLRELGLIDRLYTWTADLVGSETRAGLLEQRLPVERILHPADVRSGDVLVSRDRADDGNDAPDHVYLAVGDPAGSDPANPFVLVVDNYCVSGKPYWRNLGKGGFYGGAWRNKTPLAYALRFVAPQPVSPQASAEVQLARQQLVDALADAYRAAQRAELSQATLQQLNNFRHSSELKGLRPSEHKHMFRL
jgi:hypothetical protein